MDESSEVGFTDNEIRAAQAETLRAYKRNVKTAWEFFTDAMPPGSRRIDGYRYSQWLSEEFGKRDAKQLGAHLGAAGKRARREFTRRLLEIRREQDSLDLTVVGARYLYEQATGFGPAMPFLLEHYGNKGRTASDKSELLEGEREGLNAIAAEIEPHVRPLLADMERIRAGVEERTWEKVKQREKNARELRNPARGPVKSVQKRKRA